MSQEELEIVNAFVAVLEKKDYEKAAKSLAEDTFTMTTPHKEFKTIQEWIDEFPKFHNTSPQFESPMIDAEQGKIIRKGKAKVAIVTFKVQETYHLDSDGKIEHIFAARV